MIYLYSSLIVLEIFGNTFLLNGGIKMQYESNKKVELCHSNDGRLFITALGGESKVVQEVYVSNFKDHRWITFKCSDGSNISLSYTPE